MTKTLDDNTQASYPGRIRLSHAKLRRLQPELYGPLSRIGWYWVNGRLWSRRSFWLTHLEEHLLFGDSRAAVVITTSPLLVAAYSDELDCIALLRFPDSFVAEYNLELNSRLVTVNLYEEMNGSYETDLMPGPAARGYYRNFTPLIADFLTDDVERLTERKAEISEHEWRRTKELGRSYVNENYARPRDGSPIWSYVPADQKEPEPVAAPSEPPITLLEVPKRIVFLIASVLFTLIGVSQIPAHPRLGWFSVAVFGTTMWFTIIDIVRLPRDLKKSIALRQVWAFKSAYTKIGTVAVSFLLGLAGEIVFDGMRGVWPKLAIWLSSFVTIAALYPLRGELKKDFPNFAFWALYAALCGFVSVAATLFIAWL